MTYIDAHAHAFSHHANFLPTARYTPSYTASVEDYIQNLDHHGFDKGILIQPSFYGTDNSYMLSAIASYPERLKGIAVLDNNRDIMSLRNLDNQGIVGIRLNLFGLPCPDLNQVDWQVFLKNIADMNWQIELHAPPTYLIQLLPKLKLYAIDVTIDHFGRFDPIKGVDDTDYKHFLDLLDPNQHWVKVSGYYRLDDELSIKNATDAFKLLMQRGMKNHLIWGSDWPHTQHESQMSFDKALSSFKKIIDDEKLVTQILTRNNADLFGF
ncbi:amidohydrolase family protein [Psychrobacter jeotgali]|uniref:amidohydrolase family protein n=1 Tax=Psychrobacter jeotgali TaxID=179010 RepID=UPI00191A5DF3|nr:amidohydrolase family protein [Psychrobacter jeotgali]